MLGDLGKLIVAKGFKKLPKVQKIARSGHTGCKAVIDEFYPRTCLEDHIFKHNFSALFSLSLADTVW